MLWKDVPEADRVTREVVAYCGNAMANRRPTPSNISAAQDWVNRIVRQWHDARCARAIKWTFGQPAKLRQTLYRQCPSQVHRDGLCRSHARQVGLSDRGSNMGGETDALSSVQGIAYMDKTYHGKAEGYA